MKKAGTINFQTQFMQDNNTFDAIVVGSGITGGWAAKELTEKGLKTLVLERGRQVEHVKDYPTTNDAPWQFPPPRPRYYRRSKESPGSTQGICL